MEEKAILCFANCLKSQPRPFEDLFISCFSLVESVSYLTNVIYVLSKSQWCGLISKLNSFGGLDHRKGRNQRWISLTSEDSWDWPCSQLVSVQRKTFDCSLAGNQSHLNLKTCCKSRSISNMSSKASLFPLVEFESTGRLVLILSQHTTVMREKFQAIFSTSDNNVVTTCVTILNMTHEDEECHTMISAFDTWPKTSAKDKRVFWEQIWLLSDLQQKSD